MKNGKTPTRRQKILMREHGLDSREWLVVKCQPDGIEVVKRSDLKKSGNRKVHTKFLLNEW